MNGPSGMPRTLCEKCNPSGYTFQRCYTFLSTHRRLFRHGPTQNTRFPDEPLLCNSYNCSRRDLGPVLRLPHAAIPDQVQHKTSERRRWKAP